MILAEKIFNLRKKNGWSQEELAEKLDVSRQSISKWEGAASIPDISKIIELAALFGVTTDYLLKDDMSDEQYTERDETDKRVRVSIADANDFINRKIKQGKLIGFGVMLCILGAAMLIFLLGLSELELVGASETVMTAVGLTVLLVMVAAAVAIFIISGAGMSDYRHITENNFELEYGVLGIMREKLAAFERGFIYSVVIGVVICIISAVPLIVTSMFDESGMYSLLMVSLLMLAVACAVYIFVTKGTVKGAFDQILSRGEYSPEFIKRNKIVERIAGVYWPLMTAAYLLWSFLSGDWHITWVIWPVSGLVFGGISAVFGYEEK